VHWEPQGGIAGRLVDLGLDARVPTVVALLRLPERLAKATTGQAAGALGRPAVDRFGAQSSEGAALAAGLALPE
jgi:hypothetical protein